MIRPVHAEQNANNGGACATQTLDGSAAGAGSAVLFLGGCGMAKLSYATPIAGMHPCDEPPLCAPQLPVTPRERCAGCGTALVCAASKESGLCGKCRPMPKKLWKMGVRK